MRERKLDCSWSGIIDFDGLDHEHQIRIQQIGLDKWLDEQIFPKPKTSVVIPKTIPKVVPTSVPQKTTKAAMIASEFLKIASQNQGIVTYSQAEKIHPTYPTDTAYYAKKLGAEVTTDRKNKIYKVTKYPA